MFSFLIIKRMLLCWWWMILLVVIIFNGIRVCWLIMGRWWMFFLVISVKVLNSVLFFIICVGLGVIIWLIGRWILREVVIIFECKFWLVIMLISLFFCVISNDDIFWFVMICVVIVIEVFIFIDIGDLLIIFLSFL